MAMYYSFIYKVEGLEGKYFLDHRYGKKGVADFFNLKERRKEIEQIACVINSDDHFNELEDIVLRATKGEINEEQLRKMIKFIQNKIEPLNPKK
ncbi:MAG: hypothetical protein IB618_01075 [Candidatus Pacearchaeota archaeon]|nr:MAG: hypothetical protein IB618_01075 [Candidatus Pacearchaeota archaeon]